MKNIFKIIAVPILGLAMVITISAAPPKEINVYIDEVHETIGFMEYDKTYIPLRAVSEALGGEVDWNGPRQLVYINKDGTYIELRIGNETAKVNEKEIEIGARAQIRADLTYVPLRFVSETLGTKVKWNEETKSVEITTEGFVPTGKPLIPKPKPPVKPAVTKEEKLKEKYTILSEQAIDMEKLPMEPVTSYTTLDKVPLGRYGHRFTEISYIDKSQLPLRLYHGMVIFDIGLTVLDNGIEVLEITHSVGNRTGAPQIAYGTQARGFMLKRDIHIVSTTETITKLDAGPFDSYGLFIVKNKYHLPSEDERDYDYKKMGVTKEDVEGILFYGDGKSVLVKMKLE